MNWMKENEKQERLDLLGKELMHASRMSDEEVRETVSQPFLYARIRARIAAEQEKRSAGEGSWWAGLLTAWRPLAGMAVMAIIAASLFLFSSVAGTNGSFISSDVDAMASGEPGFERIVFTDGEPLSNNEVLATIMNQDETDVRR